MAAMSALPSLSVSPASVSAAATAIERRQNVPISAANVRHFEFAPLTASGAISKGRRRSAMKEKETSVRWIIRSSAAAEGSSSSSTSTSTSKAEKSPDSDSWVPVIPISALPKGERRLIRQDGETVLLLWYKDEVYALENTSPAEGAYSEGLFNAKLTADGCIVCPSTETTFDLKSGEIRDWYPTNPILAFLTRPTRLLELYPVKTDGEYVYINTKQGRTGQSAEIVFGGKTEAGRTASDVSVDEVRMVVDENERGFGFTPYTEVVNGRAAMLGFTLLLVSELVTGKGFLKGLGFLDFLYQYIK